MPLLHRCQGVLATLSKAYLHHRPALSQRLLGVCPVNSSIPVSRSTLRVVPQAAEVFSKRSISTPALQADEPVAAVSSPPSTASGQIKGRIKSMLHDVSFVYKQSHRVWYNKGRSLVKYFQLYPSLFSSNDILLLLQCCGSSMADAPVSKRSELVDVLWKTLNASNIAVDISHYNSLIKLYIENASAVAPTDLLKEINQHGLTPNRITYQLLINLCCQHLDINGAAAILEFMKDNNIATSEKVMESLIYGHASLGNMAAAQNLMDVITEKNGSVSTDGITSLLLGMARNGKSCEEISAKMTEAMENDHVFYDAHYFSIMMEMLKSGHREEAIKMADLMPKTKGYFNRLRNFIPQMIFAGEYELPLELYKNWQFRPSTEDNTNQSEMQGFFIVRAMIHNSLPASKVLSAIDLLTPESPDHHRINSISRALFAYIENDNLNEAKALLSSVADPKSLLRGDLYTSYIKGFLNMTCDRNDVLKLLGNLLSLKIYPAQPCFSEFLLQSLFDDTTKKPTNVLREIANEMSKGSYLPRSFLSNGIIRSLLGKGDSDSFDKATEFCLFVHSRGLRASLFTHSLAKSYLATQDMTNLMAFLFMCHTYNDHSSEVLNTLPLIHSYSKNYIMHKSPEQVLRQVLVEMKLRGIGITDELRKDLGALLQDDVQLLDDLAEIYSKRDEVWTEQRVTGACLELRGKWKDSKASSQHKSTLLALDEKVDRLLSEGSDAEVKELVMDTLRKPSSKIFAHTLALLAQHLIKTGSDEDLLQLLSSLPHESDGRVVSGQRYQEFQSFMRQFVELQRPDMVDKCTDILYKKKYVMLRSTLNPLLEVHLKRDDIDAAVQTFLTFAQNNKLLPQIFPLMEKLVQDKDVAKMQQIADVCIERLGEEKAILELTFCFLRLKKFPQARKLLLTPGLEYDHDRLARMCDFFVKNNDHEALEKLVEYTRPLFKCRRDYLFERLVKLSSNHVDRMNEAWLLMQDEGFIPSNSLKKSMAATFLQADHPIPFHYEGKVTSRSASSSGMLLRTELRKGVPQLIELLKSDTPHFQYIKSSLLIDCCQDEALIEAAEQLIHTRPVVALEMIKVLAAVGDTSSASSLYSKLAAASPDLTECQSNLAFYAWRGITLKHLENQLAFFQDKGAQLFRYRDIYRLMVSQYLKQGLIQEAAAKVTAVLKHECPNQSNLELAIEQCFGEMKLPEEVLSQVKQSL